MIDTGLRDRIRSTQVALRRVFFRNWAGTAGSICWLLGITCDAIAWFTGRAWFVWSAASLIVAAMVLWAIDGLIERRRWKRSTP